MHSHNPNRSRRTKKKTRTRQSQAILRGHIKKNQNKDVVAVHIFEEDEKEDDNYKEVAVLPAGASFGELALISHKPRAATIRAKEDCHLAVLEKADYQKVYFGIRNTNSNNNSNC